MSDGIRSASAPNIPKNEVVVVFKGKFDGLKEYVSDLNDEIAAIRKDFKNCRILGLEISSGEIKQHEISSDIEERIKKSEEHTKDNYLEEFKNTGLRADDYFDFAIDSSFIIVEFFSEKFSIKVYPNFGYFNNRADSFEFPLGKAWKLFSLIQKICHQRSIFAGTAAHNDDSLLKPDISLMVCEHYSEMFTPYSRAEDGAYHLRHGKEFDYCEYLAKWDGDGELYLKAIELSDDYSVGFPFDRHIHRLTGKKASVILEAAGNYMFSVNREKISSGVYCVLIYYSDKKFDLSKISRESFRGGLVTTKDDSPPYVPSFNGTPGRWGVIPFWKVLEKGKFDRDEYFENMVVKLKSDIPERESSLNEDNLAGSSSTGDNSINGDDKKKIFDFNEWINSIRLNEYNQMIKDGGFDDLETLFLMTEDDLKQIGVVKLGHRRRIIAEIGSLKKEYK